MRKVAFLLTLLTTSNLIADETSTPTVELVTTIHEYCLEQQTVKTESNIENIILECVNNDLAISAYKTFNTYVELTSFIYQEKEHK